MKKVLFLMVGVLALGLVFAGCSEIARITTPGTTQEGFTYLTKGIESNPDSFPLFAGQDELVGNVLVWNDDNQVCVKFVVNPPWRLYETHLAVATSLDDIPQTKNGNPIPGKFSDGNDNLGGVIEDGPYCFSLDALGVDCGEMLVIAAHATVNPRETTCIDFENYNEKDYVISEPTTNGLVNFYMTDNTPLKNLIAGNYASLANAGVYPQVATPSTVELTSDYANIVAFTLRPSDFPSLGNGSTYVGYDDIVYDANGTGAGGKTLTDPQDLNQIALEQHVYSQGLAIVIDVSSVANVQGLSFAAIDLDHGERWYFQSFDPDNKLIDTIMLTGDDQSGDGKAFPIEFDYPVSKVAIFGGMNLGESDRIGYAIDDVCVSYLLEGDTAWGAEDIGEKPFPGNNWATYFNYTVCSCTNVPEVINGGFENPIVPDDQYDWGLYPSVTEGLGWTVEWVGEYESAPEIANLELHRSGLVVPAVKGSQYAELDSDWSGPANNPRKPSSIKIYQDLATCPGEKYTLTYAWSPRSGYDCKIEVYWDGNIVDTHSGDTSGWTMETQTVIASGYSTTLMFVETGLADSFGMFLDDVSVY